MDITADRFPFNSKLHWYLLNTQFIAMEYMIRQRCNCGHILYFTILEVCSLCSLLKPQAESLLFAAVLFLLQPIQTEVVDPVFQIEGLNKLLWLANLAFEAIELQIFNSRITGLHHLLLTTDWLAHVV